MKISRLEPQRRNPRRVSVYIDGKYRFGLDQDLVLRHDLYEGREVTESEINDILLRAEKEKIRERALRLLSYRDRSVAEMRQRLAQAGCDPDLTKSVIHELIADQSLDDQRFARSLTADATNFKPRGNLYLRRALQKKQVEAALIEEAVRNRDERELIIRLLDTTLSRFNRRDPRDRQKIIRALAYRGFTLDAILDVLGQHHD